MKEVYSCNDKESVDGLSGTFNFFRGAGTKEAGQIMMAILCVSHGKDSPGFILPHPAMHEAHSRLVLRLLYASASVVLCFPTYHLHNNYVT